MTDQLVVVVGDVINDVIVVPNGPPVTGTDTASTIEFSPGGSGANQAAWLARLGTAVRFVARVGALDLEDHRAALGRFGVEALLSPDHDQATGTIVVMVGADGERSMFTDRGANRALRAADLPAGLLEGAGLLHLSGYQLFESTTRAAVRGLWAAARRAGIATSIDPASVAGLREVGREAFLEWTSGARVAFPNLDEGRLLSGRDKPEAIAAALLECYEVVVLKLGPSGVFVASNNGDRFLVDAGPGRGRSTRPAPGTRSAQASSARGCAVEICAAVPSRASGWRN